MKIVCLTASLRLGGAERQLLGLSSVLRDAGHDVEVLAYHSDVFYSDVLSECGLQYTLIEKNGSGTIGLCSRIAKHLEDISCELLIAFLPGACTKACIVHKIYPRFTLIVSERNFSIRIRIHDLLRFLMFKEADRVVCNNFSQEELIRKKVPWLRDKVLTINNFVDIDKFSPALSSSLSPKSTATIRRIVTVARLCPRKNTVGLIKAAVILKRDNMLPPFRVDWYGGNGGGLYARRCHRMIRRFGLEEVFIIHPANPDTAPLYGNADIFCLPSFYEGTSNALAEALSCGKMAAVSDVGDNPRYVRENINGHLFNPKDSRNIASALRKCIVASDATMTGFGLESRKIAELSLMRNDFCCRWLKILKKK